MELELRLDPDDAARLSRLAYLAPLKSGKARSRPVRIIWHDSPGRALAREGLILAEQRPAWRLERMYPGNESWPPGLPAPVLATGRDPAMFGQIPPDPLVPSAAFEGRASSLALTTEQGPVAMTVVTGALRAVAGERRVCRVRLEGTAQAVLPLTLALTHELPLVVPRDSLAAEAVGVATGSLPPPRRQGAPELPPGLSVGVAFQHVVGHLADVILHLAPVAAEVTDDPEPVHQMRVAVRRLRSAIKVFRPAVRCPEVEVIDNGLRALAKRLGPTRDWDVFVTETGAAVVGAFAAEKRLQRLIAAAERRRRTCHEALTTYLATVDFRRLGIELACLAGGHDWHATQGETERAELDLPLVEFAAAVLNKRLKKLQHADDDIAALAPADLHALRLRAKRVRYAAEIFAPLYPGKPANRFIRRLSRLQMRLGALNDGAVAAGLLEELARQGGGHGFATGLVLGYVGAHGRESRQRIDKAWRAFHRTPPFWS